VTLRFGLLPPPPATSDEVRVAVVELIDAG
jgi:hypothetical protein